MFTPSPFSPKMICTADALVAISDRILKSIDELSKVEYNKKGRKYKFVNNHFQRVREEEKHLIIYPEDLSAKMGIILSYHILKNINGGIILEQFPDLCLSIIGVANQLEVNKWYEEENSSVVNYKNSKFDPLVSKDDAIVYSEGVTDDHVRRGLDIMVCSKLNFLHTDHHIGIKLDSHYIRHYVSEHFGPEALNNPDVLVALKSFVHWGNIKGILYKLDIPNINISDELRSNFAKFPDPPTDLKDNVYDRYPSGTSLYSLIRKAIDMLGDYKYSKLIHYPTDPLYDLDWIFNLCNDIENNPIRYHLRSTKKSLCIDPINLNELTQEHSTQIKNLLALISLVFNVFENTGGEFLLQNSKIPKLDDELIEKHLDYYHELCDVKDKITEYELKDWDANDIVLRLQKNESSIFNSVMEMRLKYIDNCE